MLESDPRSARISSAANQPAVQGEHDEEQDNARATQRSLIVQRYGSGSGSGSKT